MIVPVTPTETLDPYAGWAALKHGGLLISPSRLSEFFVDPIPSLPRYTEDVLRRDVMRVKNGEKEHLPVLLNTVLESVLGLDKAWWLKGSAVDRSWTQQAITGEAIKPRRIWLEPKGGMGVRVVVDLME